MLKMLVKATECIANVVLLQLQLYLVSGVEIRKSCQWPFGPLMLYFLGPSQSFKVPDFLFSQRGL